MPKIMMAKSFESKIKGIYSLKEDAELFERERILHMKDIKEFEEEKTNSDNLEIDTQTTSENEKVSSVKDEDLKEPTVSLEEAVELSKNK